MCWSLDFLRSLAVEAGFYGDCGRVVGSFTKLSNDERARGLID